MCALEIKYKIILFLIYLIQIQLASAFENTIDFQIDDSTSVQTVYLFDLNQTDSTHVSLNCSTDRFYLKTNLNLVYLVYLNSIRENNNCAPNTHLLDLILINSKSGLSSIRSLNVTVNYKNQHLCEPKPTSKLLNIEYIFKISNESDYGLIKDDTNANGIIAIVRTNSSLMNKTELSFASIQYNNESYLKENFFVIKKFLSNFYMICLTESSRRLFQLGYLNENKIKLEITMATTGLKQVIASDQLQFKIINAKSLDIQLKNDIG
jgi:hypothetical protein